MSHIDQNDGIRYADGDEEYLVDGYVYVKGKVPVHFRTNDEPGSVGFINEVAYAMDFDLFDYEIVDSDFEIEIVKREE